MQKCYFSKYFFGITEFFYFFYKERYLCAKSGMQNFKIGHHTKITEPIHTKLAEDVENHNNYNIAKFQAKKEI